VLRRGDTDYALTRNVDRWDAEGVAFVFGYDARPNLVHQAEGVDDRMYHELVKEPNGSGRPPLGAPRRRSRTTSRGNDYEVLRTPGEDVCELDYRPRACKHDYRVVASRKDLSAERGDNAGFDEHRRFLYITGLPRATIADGVVTQARRRYDQDDLVAQLKGPVRALRAPVNTLVASWAYRVMAALARSLEALSWSRATPRWRTPHDQRRRRLLTMDFRTFRTFRRAAIDSPYPIITAVGCAGVCSPGSPGSKCSSDSPAP